MLVIMQSQITPISPGERAAQDTPKRPWLSAYGKFLLSPEESLILKIAPLAFFIGAPELIATEFLPIIGEVSDVGVLILIVIVAVRTIRAVQRYR